MALGFAGAYACGWRGPVHDRCTEAVVHNMWTTDTLIEALATGLHRVAPDAPKMTPDVVDSILRNRAAYRDPAIYSSDTGDSFGTPVNSPEDRRRAIYDASCQADYDYTQEFADLVAFNVNLNSICLQVVTKDQIHVETTKLAELKKIHDPEERRLAALAILKEIRDLCDLGTFELVEREPNSKPIGSRLVLNQVQS